MTDEVHGPLLLYYYYVRCDGKDKTQGGKRPLVFNYFTPLNNKCGYNKQEKLHFFKPTERIQPTSVMNFRACEAEAEPRERGAGSVEFGVLFCGAFPRNEPSGVCHSCHVAPALAERATPASSCKFCLPLLVSLGTKSPPAICFSAFDVGMIKH